MVRRFRPDPLPAGVVAELCDLARRAPSAGNTAAVHLVVLEGDEVARYWDVTLPPGAGRDRFAFPGLLAAPALVLPVTDPGAYPRRYAEDDKATTGLGSGTDAWPVPYWWVDGGMAVMTLLLGARSRGLGACLFGVFEHEPAVRAALGIPADRRLLGAIALGVPTPGDRPGRSSGRGRRRLDEVVHRGRW